MPRIEQAGQALAAYWGLVQGLLMLALSMNSEEGRSTEVEAMLACAALG